MTFLRCSSAATTTRGLPGVGGRVVHRHVDVIQLELRRAVAGVCGVRLSWWDHGRCHRMA